ncbi:MAG: CotH kinase family protein, partial [Candidatus Peregrinibacteria bacterium]|nr:CotH kinase family protein [Candidatus Peregrinibacteria bacterium]
MNKKKGRTIIFLVGIIILVLWHFEVISQWRYFTFADKNFPESRFSLGDYYERVVRSYVAKGRSVYYSFFLKKSEIERLDIFIDQKEISELNAKLPKSGQEYKKAKLFHNGEKYTSKIRYRGDNNYHWFFGKKSLKIKLKNKKTLWGHRELNLTNVKSASYLNEYIGNKLAENLGLFTIKEHFVEVYLNNVYQGVYLYLEPLDKVFVESNGLALGSIFSGD